MCPASFSWYFFMQLELWLVQAYHEQMFLIAEVFQVLSYASN